MQKIVKEASFALFYALVSVYSAILIVVGATNIVYAQEERNYRLENVERRVAEMESLKVDQRLTRVETILSSLEMGHTDWFSYAGNGGIGLLLARALYLDIRKRRGIE